MEERFGTKKRGNVVPRGSLTSEKETNQWRCLLLSVSSFFHHEKASKLLLRFFVASYF